MTHESQRRAAGGRVRLIGGRWRGRLLEVADVPGLRPTGNRLRETVFNWLQWDVVGARCLDLYAGTGALGLEAMSRGAASLTLVEASKPACESLQRNLTTLQAGESIRVHAGTAEEFIVSTAHVFDLVFVDPPFAEPQHWSVLAALEPLLAANAHIYVESPHTLDVDALAPAHWERIRCKRFGEVTAAVFGAGPAVS